jgi:peptide/nickel transport system ATP-binding protein
VLYAGQLIEQGPARELFADPRHPYTLALLRCMPRLGMRKDADRLEPIPGTLPPLGAPLSGCVYADRCPIARAECRAEPPPMLESGPARVARCLFHDEVPAIPPSAPGLLGGAPHARAGEALLGLSEVVKRYSGDVVAVAGVDLEVGRGEVLGLVGESGSGKTTLAKCIVGLVDATSGEVTLDGAALAGDRDRAQRRAVQMVFQNPDSALNPRKTVRSIIGRALRALAGLRGRAQDERTEALAASVRLEPRHLDARPSALSGGLKQRVAIARSFAGTPALVLCDEPTSALDVSVQAAILNLLVDLQAQEGVSYVFISHDLAVVRYVADRIAVMYLGQIVDIGPAERVFEPPHHPYTEALLSAIPTLAAGARPRIRLHGPIPSPSDPPSGCRFHTRCPRVIAGLCAEVEPPWQDDADGHRYRCHIRPDDLTRVQRG